LRLWAIKQASPGRGGGPYYMIFHYQKHTVLNYSLFGCLFVAKNLK
jgi:hypothetical protein